MARTHRKKSSYSRYSGSVIAGWDEKTFNRRLKSVYKYAKTDIAKLEKGTKQIGPELTMHGNKTYSKLVSWTKKVEEAKGDRKLLENLFKEGSKLIISAYSTPSSILKHDKETLKKHPSLKGLNLATRQEVLNNAKDVFARFDSKDIDRLTSERIIQIVREFMEQGLSGKELIDRAVRECEDYLDAIKDTEDEEFEEGQELDPWNL